MKNLKVDYKANLLNLGLEAIEENLSNHYR